jgi:hypothetical protein
MYLQYNNNFKKEKKSYHARARHWWLMLIILPTWEAEIRRITVQGQPGKIVCKTLF